MSFCSPLLNCVFGHFSEQDNIPIVDRSRGDRNGYGAMQVAFVGVPRATLSSSIPQDALGAEIPKSTGDVPGINDVPRYRFRSKVNNWKTIKNIRPLRHMQSLFRSIGGALGGVRAFYCLTGLHQSQSSVDKKQGSRYFRPEKYFVAVGCIGALSGFILLFKVLDKVYLDPRFNVNMAVGGFFIALGLFLAVGWMVLSALGFVSTHEDVPRLASLLAVPSDSFTEFPNSRSSVADKTWTSTKPVERNRAWQREPICVTSGMFSPRVVRVVDAFSDIELYCFSFLQLRQIHCGLAYLCDLFHAGWKREFHGRFGYLRIAVTVREFIEEWITPFLLWNDFRHIEEKRVYLQCGHVAYVLDKNLHIPSSQRVGLCAASQWHEQFWGPTVNYEWRMLDVQNIMALRAWITVTVI
jgi:hypothetical protein